MDSIYIRHALSWIQIHMKAKMCSMFVVQKHKTLLTVGSLCCGPGDWQCGRASPKTLQTPDSINNKPLINYHQD